MLFLRMALLGVTLYASQICVAEYITPPEMRYSYFASGAMESEYGVDSQGRPHGAWMSYFADGTLRERTVYDHGQWVHIQHFAPNGQLLSESKEGLGFVTLTQVWNVDGSPSR